MYENTPMHQTTLDHVITFILNNLSGLTMGIKAYTPTKHCAVKIGLRCICLKCSLNYSFLR